MSKLGLLFVLVYLFLLLMAVRNGAHFAFYLYEFVYFLNPDFRWWASSLPGLPYAFISSVTLIILFILKARSYQNNKLKDLPIFKWLIFLLISYFIVYFYAIDSTLHYTAMIDFAKLLIVLSVAYKVIDTENKFETMLIFYIFGAAYIGYEAFIVGRNEFGRVEGIGMIDSPDGNGFSAAMVPAISLLIFFFWRGEKKIKFMMMLFGLFIINGLILINSRGAFLGAAISAFYFLWEMSRAKVKIKYQRILVVFFLIISLSALYNLTDNTFIERMNTIKEVDDDSSSGARRHHFWIIALEMSKTYPWGTGAYGYDILSPLYVPYEYRKYSKTKLRAVHSIWFQALSEVGWHGFIIFLIIILLSLKMIKLTKQISLKHNDPYNYYLSHALLCSFIGLLFSSTFINQFRASITFWMILFISCHYIIIQRKYQSTENNKDNEAT